MVRLYTLDKKLAQDPEEIRRFMSNASAKSKRQASLHSRGL